MGLALVLDKNGRPVPSEKNWRQLLSNDPILSTLRMNLRRSVIEWSGELPKWRTAITTHDLRDSDFQEVRAYLEIEHDFRAGSPTNVADHLKPAAERRAYDPVREYVEGLPAWDGVERAETCLPGMDPGDAEGRRCLHLALTGAVKRALNPGCEFDHMVILVGDQGVGKTRSVRRLFRGWVTPLGRFDNKDDEIRYARAWCVMDDERVASLAAGSRGAEQYKDWLTHTFFQGRGAYERVTQEWPRAYVVWGATNDPSFLRAQEGNRRYLPIRLSASSTEEINRLDDPAFVAQVWAEAKTWYERGDRTYIDRDTELPAHQRYLDSFLDDGDDDLLSRLRQFLLTPVPAEWAQWSLGRQVDWWQSHEDAGSLAAGVAAVGSSTEVPVAGDPPSRFDYPEGLSAPDRVYLEQLMALLAPDVRVSQRESVRFMLGRELRQLGWVRRSVRFSGAVRKGYRPGPGWGEYVNEQKEAGLL